MPKINTTDKSIESIDKKYCRIKLTGDDPKHHRLVESKEGTLEYQLGLGDINKINARKFRSSIRQVVKGAQEHQLNDIVLELHPDSFSDLKHYGSEWFWQTLAENLSIASHKFTLYKTAKKKEKKGLESIIVCGIKEKKDREAFDKGIIIGEYVNKARDIANTSGADMTPADLAKVAKELIRGTKATVKILSEKELKKLKMGALLAVGQGTDIESKLIIVEYWGAGKPAKNKPASESQPIVLVGKGITYDSGGLNIKPSGFMHEMHLDMSGGSSVLATVAIIAKLKLKKNVIALVPAAENAVSDKAMRSGDIITTMNGTTVEVLHTDAEGRLVMADALTYSERYKPRAILDVATLTGASLVALGQHASAIMTKNQELEEKLRSLGEETGDLVWPLPLWEEYKQCLKSHRADISNIATDFSRYGGAIEGGTFLSHFVPKNTPWAHIDMAPRMSSIASDKLDKGSTGEPIKLLVRFVETF